MNIPHPSFSNPPLLIPASHNDSAGLLGEQYQVRTLLREPRTLERAPDRTYNDETQLWQDILAERLHAELRLCLDGFRLFEWLPRSPGLYHTQHARDARAEAHYNIDHALSSRQDHRNNTPNLKKEADRWVVYNSSGKLSMLRGGVGAIRLGPVEFPFGQYWFMGATSDLCPDGGLPVAIPNDYYRYLMDEIRTTGFAFRRIIGTIKFLPADEIPIYSFSHGISHLYLLVDDIQHAGSSARRDAVTTHISVAASFISSFEGNDNRLYATYVTFNPSVDGDKADAIGWMKDVYVEGKYKGKIVTDFDQQAPCFTDVLFSLDDILKSNDPQRLVTKVADALDEYAGSGGYDIRRASNILRSETPAAVYNIYAQTLFYSSPGAVSVGGSNEVQVATGDGTVTRNGGATMSTEKLQSLLAFIFGVVFLGALLALVTFNPNPTPEQFEIYRIVIALAAGGVFAVVPGFLKLDLSIGQDFAARAGGAVAVFVAVYFYSPAHWAVGQ